MHELSIARAILETAERHADGHRVLRVDLTIGALRQVVPGSLQFGFDVLAQGTLCAQAELQMRLAPARLRCECGEEWELHEPSFRCPRCSAAGAMVVDGEQLTIDSIELEEERCTAQG